MNACDQTFAFITHFVAMNCEKYEMNVLLSRVECVLLVAIMRKNISRKMLNKVHFKKEKKDTLKKNKSHCLISYVLVPSIHVKLYKFSAC